MFSFNKYWQTIFQRKCNKLHSHHQIHWSSRSLPTFRDVSVLLYFSHSSEYRMYFIGVLFIFFLIMNEVEHVFLIIDHLDGLYLKYLPKCLANFFIGLSILMMLIWNTSLHILEFCYSCLYVCIKTRIHLHIIFSLWLTFPKS